MRRLDLEIKYQSAGKANLDIVMKELRMRRIELGLSQRDVANIAGISLSTVSKYENGRYPTCLVWYAAMIVALGYVMVPVPFETAEPIDRSDE